MADMAEGLLKEDANQDLEKAHYMEVRYAFLEYSAYMEQAVERIEGRLDQLPRASREVMSSTATKRCCIADIPYFIRFFPTVIDRESFIIFGAPH